MDLSKLLLYIPGILIFLVGSGQLRRGPGLFRGKGNVRATVVRCDHVVKKDRKDRDTYNYYNVLVEYVNPANGKRERVTAKSPTQYATSWAQFGRSIPCYGTTHADYYYGEVPCLRCLTEEEIEDAYELNTGKLIVDEFERMGKDPEAVSAVICKNHGPFAWGKNPEDAVHCAVVLEEVAKMAFRTELINPKVQPAPQELQDKHYYRKHGANAYYGQGGAK